MRVEARRQRLHEPGRGENHGRRNGREDPGKRAAQLEEQRGALRAAGGREHGHEGEHDAVDEHRIQRVQRAHGHGQRIGQAVRAEQIGGQRHPHETQNIARQDAGDDDQSAADQGTLHGASQYPLIEDLRH